jgi:hypothetical protein
MVLQLTCMHLYAFSSFMEQSTVDSAAPDKSKVLKEPDGLLSLLACKCPRWREQIRTRKITGNASK